MIVKNTANRNINKNFVIENISEEVSSACTAFYSNFITSCSGNTSVRLGTNIITFNSDTLISGDITGNTYYGDGSQLSGISTDNDYTTGATLLNNIIYYDRTDALSAYSVSLSAFSSGDFVSKTGDTMTGQLIVTGDSIHSSYGVYVDYDENDKNIYVETTGDDVTGDGTSVGTAFRTIGRAFDDIKGGLLNSIVIIYLGSGTFDLTKEEHKKLNRIRNIGNGAVRLTGTLTELYSGITTTIPDSTDIFVVNITGSYSDNELNNKLLGRTPVSSVFFCSPILSNSGSTLNIANAAAASVANYASIYDYATTINNVDDITYFLDTSSEEISQRNGSRLYSNLKFVSSVSTTVNKDINFINCLFDYSGTTNTEISFYNSGLIRGCTLVGNATNSGLRWAFQSKNVYNTIITNVGVKDGHTFFGGRIPIAVNGVLSHNMGNVMTIPSDSTGIRITNFKAISGTTLFNFGYTTSECMVELVDGYVIVDGVDYGVNYNDSSILMGTNARIYVPNFIGTFDIAVSKDGGDLENELIVPILNRDIQISGVTNPVIWYDHHLVNRTTDLYNLGDTGHSWNNLYLGDSIYQGTDKVISVTGSQVTFNDAYKFPIIDGNTNEILRTNGSGVLSWYDIQSDLNNKYDKTGGTVTGDVLITGNVTIQGTATTVHSTNVLIDDNILTLAANQTGSTAPLVVNSGLDVLRNSATTASLLWSELNTQWEAGLSGSTSKIILFSDDYYVKNSGDTMTGNLSITPLANSNEYALIANTGGTITTADTVELSAITVELSALTVNQLTVETLSATTISADTIVIGSSQSYGLTADTTIDTVIGENNGFWKYFVSGGTNFRSGYVVATWDNTTTSRYEDFGTNDIGDTQAVIFSGSNTSGTFTLSALISGDTWNIRYRKDTL